MAEARALRHMWTTVALRTADNRFCDLRKGLFARAFQTQDIEAFHVRQVQLKREIVCMELKVFTLPTCKDCPAAKRVSKEMADQYGLTYVEVDISTPDGQLEGLMHQIMSTPSIVIDEEVVARGKLPSRVELETEIRKLLGR